MYYITSLSLFCIFVHKIGSYVVSVSSYLVIVVSSYS